MPDQIYEIIEESKKEFNNPFHKTATDFAADLLASFAHRLAKTEPLRRYIVANIEKRIFTGLKESRRDPSCLPGIADDKTVMHLGIVHSIELALAEDLLSPSARRAITKILVQSLFLEHGDQSSAQRFERQYGMCAPTFLVISSGKGCNLRCTGCYADATEAARNLDWSIVDRIAMEAKILWGARFFVISGGEPFAYRSEGKGIVALIEKHSDRLFIMFTNGTLINEKVGKRLAQARTDTRRGADVFEKILGILGGFSSTCPAVVPSPLDLMPTP